MFPVFIISLKDETARREAIAEHLKERGFTYEFFDAVDGRPMNVLAHPDYDGKRRRATHGRDLKPGELGCFLSHRAIYQKIIDDNLDYAFIIEDDARFDEDTKDVLEAVITKNIKFDIIRLLGSPKVARSKFRKIVTLYKDFSLVRLRTNPGGTHAALFSRAGAEKFLKSMNKIAFPIDTLTGRSWETGLQNYSIQPGLSIQDMSFESAIGDDRHDKTIPLTGAAKLKFKLTRLAFKIGEAIGKARIYWLNAPKDLATRKKFS